MRLFFCAVIDVKATALLHLQAACVYDELWEGAQKMIPGRLRFLLPTMSYQQGNSIPCTVRLF